MTIGEKIKMRILPFTVASSVKNTDHKGKMKQNNSENRDERIIPQTND